MEWWESWEDSRGYGRYGGVDFVHRIQLAAVFTSEEPTRFGIGCLGSRLLSGSLPSRTIKADR